MRAPDVPLHKQLTPGLALGGRHRRRDLQMGQNDRGGHGYKRGVAICPYLPHRRRDGAVHVLQLRPGHQAVAAEPEELVGEELYCDV